MLRNLNKIPKERSVRLLDYSELRGRIRARFKTQATFAKALGISNCTLSQKLNGASEWTAAEIRKACQLLDIPPDQIPRYFFCVKC